MNIGIFGGSFDPIHWGHLVLAEQCREQAELDRVLFVPAATSPFKPEGPTAGERQRVEMVELAIAGHDAFELSLVELERGGISYTVDSVRHLQSADPRAQWFLIMGADTLCEFDGWREPRAICELARLLVVRRPGTPVQWPRAARAAARQTGPPTIVEVDLPAIEISSSDIRRRIAERRSVRYLLPRSVEVYVQTHGLYAAGQLRNPSSS